MQAATEEQKKEIDDLLSNNASDKVERMLHIYKDCNIDAWAKELKESYMDKAMQHLEDIAVVSVRKKPLHELAAYLVSRDS